MHLCVRTEKNPNGAHTTNVAASSVRLAQRIVGPRHMGPGRPPYVHNIRIIRARMPRDIHLGGEEQSILSIVHSPRVYLHSFTATATAGFAPRRLDARTTYVRRQANLRKNMADAQATVYRDVG